MKKPVGIQKHMNFNVLSRRVQLEKICILDARRNGVVGEPML